MLQILFVAPLITPSLCLPSTDFAPKREVGQKITSSLSVESEFELVEFTASEDGEEVPAEMLPEMSRTTTDSQALEFIDTVKAVEEGAATAFERLYGEASGAFEFDMEMGGDGEGMEPVHESHEVTSEVVGGTVLFESDGEEWKPSAGEDCEVDEEGLAALRADYTFTFLMPAESKDEGDSWPIDVAHLASLLDPVGELPMEEDDDSEFMMGPDGETHGEPEFSGDILATFGGEREVDGRTLQVITLKFDCMSEHAFDVDLDAFSDGGEDGGFGPASLDVQIDEVIDGTGEVLYDLELGLIEQVSLQFSIERTKVENMSFDVPEMGTVDVIQSEVESGTTEIEFQSSLS